MRRAHFANLDIGSNGKTWKLYAEQTLTLASTVKVGPALTSHNPPVAAKAALRDRTEDS